MLTIHWVNLSNDNRRAVDEAVFDAYLRKVLLPTLHPGQVVIMDNLSSHKTARIAELIAQAGCQVVYLPAYSPDFSPIEKAFSKFKAFVRRSRCRTTAALIRAIAPGLDKITAEDARSYSAHAGFRG